MKWFSNLLILFVRRYMSLAVFVFLSWWNSSSFDINDQNEHVQVLLRKVPGNFHSAERAFNEFSFLKKATCLNKWVSVSFSQFLFLVSARGNLKDLRLNETPSWIPFNRYPGRLPACICHAFGNSSSLQAIWGNRATFLSRWKLGSVKSVIEMPKALRPQNCFELCQLWLCWLPYSFIFHLNHPFPNRIGLRNPGESKAGDIVTIFESMDITLENLLYSSRYPLTLDRSSLWNEGGWYFFAIFHK